MVLHCSRLSNLLLLMFSCRRASVVAHVGPRRRGRHDRMVNMAFVPPMFATHHACAPYPLRVSSPRNVKRSLCRNHMNNVPSRLWSSTSDNAPAPTASNADDSTFFASDVSDFASLGITSPILLQRLAQLGLDRPSAIQVAAFDALRDETSVILGAETGSGKTLSYLLPLIHDILQRKAAATDGDVGYDYARALILVPNKELVQQVVRMAMGLSGGRRSIVYGGSTLPDTSLLDSGMNDEEGDDSTADVVRIAIMPGGLKEPLDFVPFRQTQALSATGTQPPIDLIISTPAAVAPLGLSPKNIPMFADIQTVVMDEADLLLDGGYIRPLQDVLLGFKRADRLDQTTFRVVGDNESTVALKTQHVFVAATLPDSGLRSVDAYLTKRFPYIRRIALDNMHMARHSGLRREQATIWIEQESKKERMKEFVRLLSNELQHDKVMVFLNSVEDVEASTLALQRAGVSCLPYHAKIPLDERTRTLDCFRRYQSGATTGNSNHDVDSTVDALAVPVLVCTDLASRGLDIPGVTAVVQLQFAGNVVSHLHRMGRCGRGAQVTRSGRGVVFFDAKERALVTTVQAAESMQSSRLTLAGDVTDAAIHELDDAVDEGFDIGIDKSEQSPETGKVTMAFSRKRGFTKKIKKVKRQIEESSGRRTDDLD